MFDSMTWTRSTKSCPAVLQLVPFLFAFASEISSRKVAGSTGSMDYQRTFLHESTDKLRLLRLELLEDGVDTESTDF